MTLIKSCIKPIGHLYSEDELLVLIGQIAGECYNSSMDEASCMRRAIQCIYRGHHSPWEHINITLKCTVDRGVSHALVRHRHCAFQQSSTIYQKFDKDIVIINTDDDLPSDVEMDLYKDIENTYHKLLSQHYPPSRARDILPNSLATNLIITTNVRQWMYMYRRRQGPGDSRSMHRWAKLVEEWFAAVYPRVDNAFSRYYKGHPL